LDQFLLRRFAAKPAPIGGQIAIGVAAGVVAVMARLGLSPVLGGGLPFILFYPMVAFSAVLGAAPGGAACLATTIVGSVLWWRMDLRSAPVPGNGLPLLLYLASGAFVVWSVSLLRRALAEVRVLSEQQQVLLFELQHRVKNTLAVAQAVAHQTLGAAPETKAARKALMERFEALAAAHDLLVATVWDAVPLAALVRGQLQPFGPEERFVLRGDDDRVPAKTVTTLALCLHELATNATKHGALSSPEGRVEVRWERVGGDRLRLTWSESGGPPVAGPRRTGFGARLLKTSAGGVGGAGPEIEFLPGGVRWVGEFEV
jgi:two-component sensor histidine kinase